LPEIQSELFVYIIALSSFINDHDVSPPPTSDEFINKFNEINNFYYSLGCRGETLEECKETLKYNILPLCENTEEKSLLTWIKMMIAFNMYAKVRKVFMIKPYNYIDGIGITNRKSNWIPFHGSCCLFINKNTLNLMLELTENCLEKDSNLKFWDCIFDIYESLNYDSRFRIKKYQLNLEEEYNCRIFKKEEKFSMSNKQIASIIKKIECELPIELKKTIHKICK